MRASGSPASSVRAGAVALWKRRVGSPAKPSRKVVMARSLDSELSAMAATSGPSTANRWCSVRAAPSSRVRSRCASVSAGSSHHGSHTSPTVTSPQRASVNPAMWS